MATERLVHLFPELEVQATELASRISKGERVVIREEPGHAALLRFVARRLGGRAVVVRVPRELDRATYVILSAAAQCDPAVQDRVAKAARSHRASAALAALDDAIDGRPLLVSGLHRLNVSSSFDLKGIAVEDFGELRTWIERRASALTSHDGTQDAVRPEVGAPPSELRALWEKTGRRSDVYFLACARQRIIGEGNGELQWDRESIAEDLWSGLTTDLQELLANLGAHGRPIRRVLVESAQLAEPATVDAALEAQILDEDGGQLWLPDPLRRALPLTDSEGALKRRMALAFEEVGLNDAMPIAVLEAHRHYAGIGDVAGARRLAHYGVELLLGMARSQSLLAREASKPSLFTKAAELYHVVLELDRQAQEGGRPGGIGRRARAYAIHYRAYNLYRADPQGISPEETLSDYREALRLWEENALFWSRALVCCFVAGRYEDAIRTLGEAMSAVPPHPAKTQTIVRRSVEQLLRRRLVLPAFLVWDSHRPTSWSETYVQRRLHARGRKGWQLTSLWAPAARLLEFVRPVRVGLVDEDDEHVLRVLEKEGRGESVQAAVRDALEHLFAEARHLLEKSDPTQTERIRLAGLRQAIDFPALVEGDEESRWVSYLATLVERVEREEMPPTQHRALLRVWERLRQACPDVRLPAAGRTDDEVYHLSWSYADLPDLVLTIEIRADGYLEWFYRDGASGKVLGTDDKPEPEVPTQVLDLVQSFRS